MTSRNSTYTHIERLGDGSEDYYGPLRSRYFAARVRRTIPSFDARSAQQLTLVIETSRDPWADSRCIDTGPAQKFADEVIELLSLDNREARTAKAVSLLNGRLAQMRGAKDLMRTFKKVHKTTTSTRSRPHPLTIFSAASAIAQEPHYQKHESLSDLKAAAQPAEWQELQEVSRSLCRSNRGIRTFVDRGTPTPTIYIYGAGLPTALRKLYAAGMVLGDMDIDMLRRNLKDWIKRKSNLTKFARKEIKPVLDVLRELDKVECAMARTRRRANSPRKIPIPQ